MSASRPAGLSAAECRLVDWRGLCRLGTLPAADSHIVNSEGGARCAGRRHSGGSEERIVRMPQRCPASRRPLVMMRESPISGRKVSCAAGFIASGCCARDGIKPREDDVPKAEGIPQRFGREGFRCSAGCRKAQFGIFPLAARGQWAGKAVAREFEVRVQGCAVLRPLGNEVSRKFGL